MPKFRNPTQEEIAYLKKKFKIIWKLIGRIIMILIFMLFLIVDTGKGLEVILVRLVSFPIIAINLYRLYMLFKFKIRIIKGNYKLVKAQCVRADDSPTSSNPDDDIITFYTFKDENGKRHKDTNSTGLLHFFSRFYYFGRISQGDNLYFISIDKKMLYFKIKNKKNA